MTGAVEKEDYRSATKESSVKRKISVRKKLGNGERAARRKDLREKI